MIFKHVRQGIKLHITMIFKFLFHNSEQKFSLQQWMYGVLVLTESCIFNEIIYSEAENDVKFYQAFIVDGRE